MASKRSRRGRSSTGSGSKRRQGHPARQAEERRLQEDRAGQRRPGRRRGAPDPASDPDVGPPPSELGAAAVAGLRPLLADVTDPLEATLVGSQVCEPWGGFAPLGDDDPEAQLGVAVVTAAEAGGDAAALAVLRALEVGATTRTAAAAAGAAARLAVRGVADPPWYAAASGLTCTGAAVLHEDDFDDGATVLVEVAGPDHPAHTAGIRIDHNAGTIATDLLVGPSLAQIAEQTRGGALQADFRDVRLERIDPFDAKGRASVALARTMMALEAPVSDDVPRLWGFVMQRLAVVPGDVPPEVADAEGRGPGPAERDALAAAFFATTGTPARDELSAALVRAAIDFAADEVGGDPLRWSPTVVELFLLGRLPGAGVVAPDAAPRVPAVLRDWVRFAGERRGTRASSIETTLRALDGLGPAFVEAAQDPSRAAAATAIAATMRDAGVDLTDPEAVATFMDDYEARLGDA